MIGDDGNAKLSDFGISRMLESRGTTTKTIGGTVRWMARELILPDEDEEDDCAAAPVTCQTDVWSFGMTVLEVVVCISSKPKLLIDNLNRFFLAHCHILNSGMIRKSS